ncbi:MAG TPA: CpsD/CapB family tyrosine-protein kinase [Candidatus Dormibacteraeota bacterium]|nr:CpsD/CapB family tyrosine-protein kinase [Candidatus Dormibacteraeota bacterium]
MSRIHEALKRAEQERASRPEGETPTQAPVSALVLPSLAEGAAGREPGPDGERLAATFPSPNFGPEAISIESLMARCSQPDWHPDVNTMLFLREGNHQYKTEVFRTLRSRLYRFRDQISLRTLLITSTLPSEGKSFIAANLSQAIAQQHGRRTLLIDADLRIPRLHTLLGAPQSPGLTDYLRGEADETAVIQRGPRDGFFFLPCGAAVANPVELIGNGRMKELLERLTPVFDWIVLDSPPMLPVSDASLLADMCDGVLLVVRSAATPFDLAQKVCGEFKNTPLVGVVLNGIDQHSNYGNYYYNSYGSNGEAPKG